MNRIFLLIIILICLFSIVTNFGPVFLEEKNDKKQLAFEYIEHKMVDHSEKTILLETSEVKLLIEKARQHYLDQWNSKSNHFILSIVILLISLFLFKNEIKSKK